MKLLLFDIDGTILHTRNHGRRLIESSLEEVLGRPVDTSRVSFSGKTDPQIFAEILAGLGYGADEQDAHYRAALAIYTEAMITRIHRDGVHLYPGLGELIRWLHTEPDVQLGLLTGNVEPMAYLKLAAVGLDGYFPLGAFGSDHADRYQLPPIAVERARHFARRDFAGTDVVIIGDTEHDINCGRGIGAFSVAVCTGHYTRQDLELHAPHVLLDDLSDLPLFIEQVLRFAA
jgi:phosphoglycolate phosphatase-like HAD superfamily hydrolase